MLRVVMLRLAVSQLRSAAAAAAADSSAVFEIILRRAFQIKYNSIIKHESMPTKTNDAKAADSSCAVSRSDLNSNANQRLFKKISGPFWLFPEPVDQWFLLEANVAIPELNCTFAHEHTSLDPFIQRKTLKRLWRQHRHTPPPPRPQHSKRHR